jgi:FkbM family methyltransferase
VSWLGERARRHASPATKQRVRSFLGWLYWSRRRLRSRIAGRRGSGGLVWTPGDSLPNGTLGCVLASNEHGSYCVPQASRHRPVAQRILVSRVWEADTLNLLREADPDGDIVHAGTFFGDFLPALSHSRAEGARVWAFEPGGENYRCTQITVLLNGLENVVLAHAALGSEPGSVLLQTTNKDGVPLGGASRVVRDAPRHGAPVREQVEIVRLDEAIADDRQIAVIHLDVERHERYALTGAMRTIERCRPVIVLETLPRADWIAQELAPLGYELDGAVDVNSVLRCRSVAAQTAG